MLVLFWIYSIYSSPVNFSTPQMCLKAVALLFSKEELANSNTNGKQKSVPRQWQAKFFKNSSIQ